MDVRRGGSWGRCRTAHWPALHPYADVRRGGGWKGWGETGGPDAGSWTRLAETGQMRFDGKRKLPDVHDPNGVLARRAESGVQTGSGNTRPVPRRPVFVGTQSMPASRGCVGLAAARGRRRQQRCRAPCRRLLYVFETTALNMPGNNDGAARRAGRSGADPAPAAVPRRFLSRRSFLPPCPERHAAAGWQARPRCLSVQQEERAALPCYLRGIGAGAKGAERWVDPTTRMAGG